MLFALLRRVVVAISLAVICLMFVSPALAGPGSKGKAPEIDPGSAVSGMVLLGGGMLLLADSRRRKN